MNTDFVQRFLFENLDIRGRLVCLTGAWRRMTEGRSYPPRIAELLGHSTALIAILGASQKASGRITLQVQGAGAVKLLVADCTPGMKIRGMAQYARDVDADARAGQLLGDGKLAVTLEDADSGQIYQSFVPLEGDSLGEIFEHYLAQSEQLTSFLRLYASADRENAAVCGLLLEKLPGADAKDPDGWNRVTHLAATLRLRETIDAQPYGLLVRLFPGELLRVFPLDPVEYHCPFDVQNVERVLRGLGRDEVESILDERGEVVIRNEMCNHEYRFDRAAVETLFA
ncbi:MAG TPA: Hsp33 family molecular chaperone HslO [Burkholderiales bacterium]|nr:Hsp33 family molecular chaperone HslO [Burkholderiales bacterium]